MLTSFKCLGAFHSFVFTSFKWFDIRDEEFCLQLDAHSQLLADWDTKLVKEWVRTDNEMAVLTAYPSGFHMIGENGTY
ncbi:hypothetical protein H257_17208 [Aphanomyces astaci]|uniref:Uncharacterized protein n=1 Tax=Aphanomyces astaci TaxID=112090 RepID=W4FHG7_APHAT|nr:hypothetical protein H257_17208 [Aphanomyces astaci]ETV66304.1 hypothetical protein H257_17208 [Aphanomyces astaci]|eukprot:XP_009844210.1 hypothetical protein H257_17208 [Aphanomyces astaci]